MPGVGEQRERPGDDGPDHLGGQDGERQRQDDGQPAPLTRRGGAGRVPVRVAVVGAHQRLPPPVRRTLRVCRTPCAPHGRRPPTGGRSGGVGVVGGAQIWTPRSRSHGIGSTFVPLRPPTCTSKCRCGPVD